MLEITQPDAMLRWSRSRRAEGHRIGFVPTMGYFHPGHLRLFEVSREHADCLVVSVFVNPLQFGPNEDLDRYPRDLARDRELAGHSGVECLFVPDTEVMYPSEPIVRVSAGRWSEVLEGAARPGHFEGVLTVVTKLLHMVEPDISVFGRKDYQQAVAVRRMLRDLSFPVEIVVAPTVRELDGLAMSSRNAYLSADARRSALALSRALRAVEQAWRNGEVDRTRLEVAGQRILRETPQIEPEYVALIDPETLDPVERADAHTVVAVAARVAGTRLIDNIILGEGFRADATAVP